MFIKAILIPIYPKEKTNIPPLEKGDKGGFKNAYFVLRLKKIKSLFSFFKLTDAKFYPFWVLPCRFDDSTNVRGVSPLQVSFQKRQP